MQVEWFRKPFMKSPFKSNHRLPPQGVRRRRPDRVHRRSRHRARSGAATPATRREWRDTHLRVEGPAVDGLQSAFIQDWAESGRPLYGDDDEFPEQPQPGGSTVQIVRGSA